MQIHARRVGVTGPHGPLLKPESLLVKPGELGAGGAAELRERVVLVDSPT